jgi:alkanesulfonate monooxygenase SsuD/methylene tetrahydromethanopterin reductase-like flavin-dependent oxidoreductase (luciferase family)
VPVQKEPRIHVAVLRNEVAPFVGAQKLPMMMIPYATTEKLGELAETTKNYREAFAAAYGDLKEIEISFGLHTHCAATTEQARKEATEPMDRYVRTRLYAKQRPIDELIQKDLVAFGDTEEVLRVAQQYQNAGLTNFLAINNFGGLPHKQVLKSMELIAKGVMQPCLSTK